MGNPITLAPDQRLLHYRLVKVIGEGGMGQVWEAFDTTLERHVALKVLPFALVDDHDRLCRFEREARLLASLNHPNVAVVHGLHEAGPVRFLVMELVEGEDLSARLGRGPLPLAEALQAGAQIAAALEATHARGIVHRDLKPANIRITRTGSIKVLDFGIAKAALQDRATDGTTIGGVYPADSTRIGAVLGTPAYMSPEQRLGLPIDPRCDIWAFACVLYEMLTGARAFASSGRPAPSTPGSTDSLDWAGLPAATPPAIRELLRRCLVEDVNRRLADIRLARRVLEDAVVVSSDGTAAVHPRPSASVAVLPFVNMSADPDNQYFSDGLSEDLINALTRLPALRVASRTSAFRFRGGDLDVRQIGDQLGVATVVEGSVRRSGHRLRVTAQLIDVVNGYHIWSERYDRQAADVFDIQDDIVASIVKALEPALLGDSREVVRRPTESLEAYELYLQGRHYWHQRSPGTLHTAIQCFDRAIAAAPSFALAYAGLADCYGLLRTYGWIPAAASRARALDAVTRAMELDPTRSDVHYSRAFFTMCFEPGWREAEQPFRDALAINGRSSLTHVYFGLFLAARYRFDEAAAHIDLACELDPLSPFVQGVAAVARFASRRFDAAEKTAARALDLQPDYILGLWVRGLALCGIDRPDEAVLSLERAATLSRAPIFVGMLGLAYGRAGRVDAAKLLLRELEERGRRGEYVMPVAPLAAFVGLADVVAVREALQACIDDVTPPQPIRTLCGPFLDDLRSDVEIDRLLGRLYDGAHP
jgi:eukaryotic-like serine/threonine-protein kinase